MEQSDDANYFAGKADVKELEGERNRKHRINHEGLPTGVPILIGILPNTN